MAHDKKLIYIEMLNKQLILSSAVPLKFHLNVKRLSKNVLMTSRFSLSLIAGICFASFFDDGNKSEKLANETIRPPTQEVFF